MEVVIPAAGNSTRFESKSPKFLLRDVHGKLMIENVIDNYINLHTTTLIIREEHDKLYRIRQLLNNIYGSSLKIVTLEKQTSGPAETVLRGIERSESFDLQEALLVRDCDSFYKSAPHSGNLIHVAKLTDYPSIKDAHAKSYVLSDEQNIISSIVEKRVISEVFCVGGYQFRYGKLYVDAVSKLLHENDKTELYVSNVADYLVINGEIFLASLVESYVDVGTQSSWLEYNAKFTIPEG